MGFDTIENFSNNASTCFPGQNATLVSIVASLYSSFLSQDLETPQTQTTTVTHTVTSVEFPEQTSLATAKATATQTAVDEGCSKSRFTYWNPLGLQLPTAQWCLWLIVLCLSGSCFLMDWAHLQEVLGATGLGKRVKRCWVAVKTHYWPNVMRVGQRVGREEVASSSSYGWTAQQGLRYQRAVKSIRFGLIPLSRRAIIHAIRPSSAVSTCDYWS